MRKIKYLLLLIITISLTGCFKNDSMDDINITTSVYPIHYVVNTLYGEHSSINSIYPSDSEIIDFEITETLLEQYSDTDLFIFNGLSDEKNYVKYLLNTNKELKIIDVTSNMILDYSMEELWLDPNNLLTIANNIKKGFNEYINSSYLKDEVNKNYENLKIELTRLDGNYYSSLKNAEYDSIIVSDDAFLFLRKYGLNVISLDSDTVTQKAINDAKELINEDKCNYIFTKYGEEYNEDLKDFISQTGVEDINLYTLTNLYNVDTRKNDYIYLITENLESIELETNK